MKKWVRIAQAILIMWLVYLLYLGINSDWSIL